MVQEPGKPGRIILESEHGQKGKDQDNLDRWRSHDWRKKERDGKTPLAWDIGGRGRSGKKKKRLGGACVGVGRVEGGNGFPCLKSQKGRFCYWERKIVFGVKFNEGGLRGGVLLLRVLVGRCQLV